MIRIQVKKNLKNRDIIVIKIKLNGINHIKNKYVNKKQEYKSIAYSAKKIKAK